MDGRIVFLFVSKCEYIGTTSKSERSRRCAASLEEQVVAKWLEQGLLHGRHYGAMGLWKLNTLALVTQVEERPRIQVRSW